MERTYERKRWRARKREIDARLIFHWQGKSKKLVVQVRKSAET